MRGPRESRRFGPLVQNRDIAIVEENPITAFTCQLSRDPEFNQEIHR